jgi:hypothetical protein
VRLPGLDARACGGPRARLPGRARVRPGRRPRWRGGSASAARGAAIPGGAGHVSRRGRSRRCASPSRLVAPPRPDASAAAPTPARAQRFRPKRGCLRPLMRARPAGRPVLSPARGRTAPPRERGRPGPGTAGRRLTAPSALAWARQRAPAPAAWAWHPAARRLPRLSGLGCAGRSPLAARHPT